MTLFKKTITSSLLGRTVRTVALSLSFSGIALTGAAHAAPEIIDRVAAVVDKEIIAMSSLESRIKDISFRAQQSNMRLPPLDVLRSQVLDQLINETLQLNMARRYGVRVADEEINETLANIAKQRNWTKDQLIQGLASEGKTLEAFADGLRQEMMMTRVSQGVVRSRIRISEQEIDNFLNSADAQFWISPDYHLGHILISLPQSPSAEKVVEAEEKANAIYQKLQKGARFEELAIAESSGPAALKGGDLGFRKSSELPTLFAQIAPKLEIGQVSAPARSQAGFHILKLIEKRGETKQIVAQVKARHILMKTSAVLTDAKAQQKLTSVRQDIIDGKVTFADMAKEYSEDIGSKLSGGDLGWAQPGTFVGPFKKAVSEQPIGIISEPFKTQFGWHIVEVQERRDEDMTKEAIRMKARELLTNRRFEDETQVWLQEMRDDAFIEIKI